MLAPASRVVDSQTMPDPLAKFRTPDGRLMIPGRALTPELQRLLFHGNDLGPLTNVTFLLPVRSSYPTERLVAISFASPNLNVFVHPRQAPETWGSAIDHVLRVWFPPVDWHEVAVGFRNSIRDGVGWFFDLFTMNAKADALTVDSTTVAVVDPAAATCTTSQSAAAGDNAVLVMLSNRGATATSLYGIAPTQCAAAPNSFCGAGADMPFPGTAITWTDGNATDWVISAVRVLPTPNCGVASGNCYRIGAGGTWATGANWSNTSGGATCSCTPVATNDVIFNATPTGTTTLAAATTIASIDMTGFTGTLDTTASNWALTVNGPFAIQGTFQARSSTIAVTGDVDVLTAGTIVSLGASSWTVNGLWTNLSTSASWAAGTSTVTIRDPASGTLTFAALAGGTNEFNNLTLDASVTPSITYTMAVNALRMGATLTIRNSTGGATGPTILTTSNLGITAGSLAVATFGSLTANGSAFVVNGNVSVSAANGYVVMGSSVWTVTGTWTNASTSASWTPGTGTVTFTSATGGAVTIRGAGLSGEQVNKLSFTPSAASAQTLTNATRALIWGGAPTIFDGSSTTALATANLRPTGGALSVGTSRCPT